MAVSVPWTAVSRPASAPIIYVTLQFLNFWAHFCKLFFYQSIWFFCPQKSPKIKHLQCPVRTDDGFFLFKVLHSFDCCQFCTGERCILFTGFCEHYIANIRGRFDCSFLQGRIIFFISKKIFSFFDFLCWNPFLFYMLYFVVFLTDQPLAVQSSIQRNLIDPAWPTPMAIPLKKALRARMKTVTSGRRDEKDSRWTRFYHCSVRRFSINYRFQKNNTSIKKYYILFLPSPSQPLAFEDLWRKVGIFVCVRPLISITILPGLPPKIRRTSSHPSVSLWAPRRFIDKVCPRPSTVNPALIILRQDKKSRCLKFTFRFFLFLEILRMFRSDTTKKHPNSVMWLQTVAHFYSQPHPSESLYALMLLT